MFRFPALGALTCAAAVPSLAAVNVSLSPASLPSQQPGWQYQTAGLHVGTPEGGAFTPHAAYLSMNTMSAPLASTSAYLGGRYNLPADAFDGATTMEINLRARVLASDVFLYHYGFGTSVTGGGRWMGFGLSTTHVTYTTLDVDAATFNPTLWHDYRMVGNLATGQAQLFVDGNLFSTRPMGNAAAPNNIFIGDSTGTANANIDIAEFAVVTPAPAALPMLGAIGAFAARRRRGK